MSYIEKLNTHLEERPGLYDEGFFQYAKRVVRVGSVAASELLEILENAEASRGRIDQGMQGMEWDQNAWDDQMVADRQAVTAFDRVFYPGEIGGVPTQATLVFPDEAA